jgi:hypothetical protein
MLDANAVAELLGKEPRVVRRWCEPNGSFKGRTCPHERVQLRKGAPDYRFNEGEVRAWARAQGLSVKPPIEAGAGPVFESAARVQAERAGIAAGDVQQPQVNVLATVPVGAERGALREQLALVMTLTAQIQRDLRSQGVAAISATSVNQLAGAADKCRLSVLAVDKAERQMAESRGELVSRSAVERVLTDLVDSVTAGHDQARQDLGPILRLAGAQIGEGDKKLVDEAFDRVVVLKCGEVLDVARGKAAEALRRARAEVERVAGGGGGERREAA